MAGWNALTGKRTGKKTGWEQAETPEGVEVDLGRAQNRARNYGMEFVEVDGQIWMTPSEHCPECGGTGQRWVRVVKGVLRFFVGVGGERTRRYAKKTPDWEEVEIVEV